MCALKKLRCLKAKLMSETILSHYQVTRTCRDTLHETIIAKYSIGQWRVGNNVYPRHQLSREKKGLATLVCVLAMAATCCVMLGKILHHALHTSGAYAPAHV